MAKPTSLPQWGSGGSIVEPPSGKKTTGWESGEIPPAEFENWRTNLVYDWLNWVNGTFSAPTLIIPASAAQSDPSQTNPPEYRIAGHVLTLSTDAGRTTDYPVNLPVGVIIDEVRAYVDENSGGTISAALFKKAYAGSASSVASGASGGGGGDEVITLASIAETTVTGTQYWVRITFATSTPVASALSHHVEIDWAWA